MTESELKALYFVTAQELELEFVPVVDIENEISALASYDVIYSQNRKSGQRRRLSECIYLNHQKLSQYDVTQVKAVIAHELCHFLCSNYSTSGGGKTIDGENHGYIFLAAQSAALLMLNYSADEVIDAATQHEKKYKLTSSKLIKKAVEIALAEKNAIKSLSEMSKIRGAHSALPVTVYERLNFAVAWATYAVLAAYVAAAFFRLI